MNVFLPRCGCNGVEGVAGTLEALRLKLEVRCMLGSSRVNEPVSSSISRSVRPVYLNFVPQEKKPPPDTTDGASELFGKLKIQNSFLPFSSIKLDVLCQKISKKLGKINIFKLLMNYLICDAYVKNNICSIAHRQTCLQDAPVGHLKPTVCFF